MRVAEAEYDADPEGLLRMLSSSPGTPRHPPAITDPHKDAGGWIGRLSMPTERLEECSRALLDFLKDL